MIYGAALRAQNVSGVTGTVTDTTGAAIPGAQVVLTNKTTGLKFTQTSTANGSYRFSEIPPGAGWELVVNAPGFAPLDIKNIYLTVSTVRTQNASLTAGSNQEVEVNASSSEVTLDTTDATVGNTFDVSKLNDLPIQQRSDPTALFTDQPGTTDTGAVTGARTDQNNVTVDGLDVNDFATGNATQTNSGITQGFSSGNLVGHAPIDSLDEFHATVGGYTASSGPSSGGQFALVTKSGTNQFHGNINEYHRDPSLVANGWFSNNASPIVPRNHLIQNQFGGNIGGPILKDKLFFFFDYNNSRVIRTALVERTVPLDSLRAGSIGYADSSGNTDYLTAAQVNAFDPAGIGESATFLAAANARFPHSNSSAVGDGINSGGYTFNAPDDDYLTNYVGRVDYNINKTMKMFARFTIARENGVETPNEFSGDPVSSPLVDRSYAFVIGHNWVIGTNKTNQFFIGETVQKLSFPITYNPDGSTYFTFGDGADESIASSFYLQPNSQSRRIPIPVIGDDFTWTKGNHTLQFGGTFKDIHADNKNVADYNTTEVGLGGHTLGLCGPVITNECGVNSVTGTPNPSLRPANIDTTQTLVWDQPFAFTLARVGDVQEDFNYDKNGNALPQLSGDERIYRYYQAQGYAADTWKVTPSLTLSYGVNYQWFSVPYETRGLESVEPQTFQSYFQDRINQSAAGLTGATAVPLLYYVLGGKANNGPGLYKPQYDLFAPRFAFAFNPRWDKKTVFNGSAGIVYDRTIINAVQAIQDQDSYLFQQTTPVAEGISGDSYDSIKNDPRLTANNTLPSSVPVVAAASPKAPYAPYVTNGVPYGLQSGGAFNATIDTGLKTPYSITFGGGFQREMPWNTVLKINYVGRLGRRLLAQVDANQILDFPDKASGEMLSTAFSNIIRKVRAGQNPASLSAEPWFEDIVTPGIGVAKGFANNTQYVASGSSGLVQNGDFGDFVQALSTITPLNVGSAAQYSENTFYTSKGYSSYNGLLVTYQKNLSNGLQFDFNYTWSHSIDNVSFFADSEGDTGIGGVGLICDDVRPRECRANSDFDVTNYITTDGTYQLPFGKHRMMLNQIPGWANEIIGGWAISGIASWHTGQAFGTASNAYVSSYSNDAPAIFSGSNPSAITPHLTKIPGGGVNIFRNNTLASSQYEGPIGFQIGPRNSLRGPNFFNADLGLAKTFPLYADKVNLKFRADAFNALNHPNFGLPQENAYNGYDQQDYQNPNFGQISYTIEPQGNLNNGARVLQLSLRLEF
jgi:hypothetical protein